MKFGNEWHIVGHYFKPYAVRLTVRALSELPAAMQEHVKNGGSLGILKEPEDGMALISTSKDHGTHAFVPVKDLITELKTNAKEAEDLPEPFRTHVLNGGTLYQIGWPEDGKVTVSTAMENGDMADVQYYQFAEYAETDLVKIAYLLREYVYMIRQDRLPVDVRGSWANWMRDYLIYCTSISELDDLTAVYRDTETDNAIGYSPVAVDDFVNRMLERYPKSDTVWGRTIQHRNQIYAEMGAVMADCFTVFQMTENETEREEAAEILHDYLEDCMTRGGMKNFAILFQDKTEDTRIGYELDAVGTFISMVIHRYPLEPAS